VLSALEDHELSSIQVFHELTQPGVGLVATKFNAHDPIPAKPLGRFDAVQAADKKHLLLLHPDSDRHLLSDQIHGSCQCAHLFLVERAALTYLNSLNVNFLRRPHDIKGLSQRRWNAPTWKRLTSLADWALNQIAPVSFAALREGLRFTLLPRIA
jgi:hypothetical protein